MWFLVFIRMPRPSFKQVREGYLLFLKNTHTRDIVRAIHHLRGQTRHLRRAIEHIYKDAAKRGAPTCNTTNGYRAIQDIGQVNINRAIARRFPYIISDAYLYIRRHGTIGKISAEASSA